MKIALIGSGVMGSAVLSSLVAADAVTEVAVTDVRGDVAREVAARHDGEAASVSGGADNAAAAAGADVVLLAVKPQYMADALASVRDAVGPDTLVVSIAAGLPSTFYERRLPAGVPVVRVMPNTPATIGRGVSAVSPGRHASPDHVALVETLLAGTGLVVSVPEALQSAVTAISGSGPAYVFAMVDALAEAGTLLGLPRALAQQLAAHTVAGSGVYAAESGQHAAILREAVSSPGGTTLAALAELDERAVRAAYVAAARAAARRADELAREADPEGADGEGHRA